MTDSEAIMGIVKTREAKMLASTSLMMDLQNPFQRPALSAGDIAWKLGWITITKAGREQADIARAKTAIAHLCAAGELVEAGSFRTMHAGSKAVLCFCTSEFMILRQRRIDELSGEIAPRGVSV